MEEERFARTIDQGMEMLTNLIDEIEADGACLTLRDLAINGRDAAALGYRGKEIGEALDIALGAVIDGVAPNEKTALTELLMKSKKI